MQNGSEYRERLWYKILAKFPTPFNRMILKKEHQEIKHAETRAESKQRDKC